jgi:hypothetical protein
MSVYWDWPEVIGAAQTGLLTQRRHQRCDRAANKKVQLSPSLPLIFLALEIPRHAVAYWLV